MCHCGFCKDDCCQDKLQDKEAPAYFKTNRSCTDLPFLLFFIAACVGMVSIFSAALKKGDPNLLIKGVDVNGVICGQGVNALNPFAVYAVMDPTLGTNFRKYKFCALDCSATLNDNRMFIPYNSTEFMGTYCLPKIGGENGLGDKYKSMGGLGGDFVTQQIQALMQTKMLFFACPIIALIVCFVWMKFIEKCGSCFVWSALLLILFAGYALGGSLFLEIKKERDLNPEAEMKTESGMMAVAFGVTTLVAIIIFYMRVRINIAVEVVKEATRAVNDMKMVLLFPLIPLFMGIIYLILWIIVCVYVASVRVDRTIDFMPFYRKGDWDSQESIQTSTFDSGMKNSALFCFFHFLWTFQFFIYLNYLVIAGALARWYFTPYDNNRQKVRGDGKNELPNRPLTASFKLTCRFHLGTIALCSFIIAVINFIRAMVKYFEEVSKSQRLPSQMQKAMFCAIHGCLWLLKCCLDKLNKNALVWVALYGNNFAVAACSSFQLLWNNLARVAAINVVGVYLLNMGKLAVGMLTTAILCFIAYGSKGMEAETIALPALMWFVFSVVIAHIFFVEMDTAVDTIFLCFLIDEKNNKANNCMLASPELQALVNKHAKESAAKAVEIKEVEMAELKASG